MDIKVNESMTLKNGKTSSAGILSLSAFKFDYAAKTVECEIKGWSSQTSKDNGDDQAPVKDGSVDGVSNMTYSISEDDYNQVITDGHYGIVGEHIPDDAKARLVEVFGFDLGNLEVTSLL